VIKSGSPISGRQAPPALAAGGGASTFFGRLPDSTVIALFEIDDDINYTELYIDDAYRPMKATMIMLTIDGDVDMKAEV
jgi:hypothetical protein